MIQLSHRCLTGYICDLLILPDHFCNYSNTRQTRKQIFFFFNHTAPTEIYTLSLHDALPICIRQSLRTRSRCRARSATSRSARVTSSRSEEHTSELQSPCNLVCRLLLEKKKEVDNQENASNPKKKPG